MNARYMAVLLCALPVLAQEPAPPARWERGPGEAWKLGEKVRVAIQVESKSRNWMPQHGPHQNLGACQFSATVLVHVTEPNERANYRIGAVEMMVERLDGTLNGETASVTSVSCPVRWSETKLCLTREPKMSGRGDGPGFELAGRVVDDLSRWLFESADFLFSRSWTSGEPVTIRGQLNHHHVAHAFFPSVGNTVPTYRDEDGPVLRALITDKAVVIEGKGAIPFEFLPGMNDCRLQEGKSELELRVEWPPTRSPAKGRASWTVAFEGFGFNDIHDGRRIETHLELRRSVSLSVTPVE